MAEETNNNSIYSEEEIEILEKTKKIRLGIMDALTKDGIPTHIGTVRVLNEVLGFSLLTRCLNTYSPN